MIYQRNLAVTYERLSCAPQSQNSIKRWSGHLRRLRKFGRHYITGRLTITTLLKS